MTNREAFEAWYLSTYGEPSAITQHGVRTRYYPPLAEAAWEAAITHIHSKPSQRVADGPGVLMAGPAWAEARAAEIDAKT